MECELCGRRAEGKAKIEGTVVSVCGSCAGFGQPVYESKPVKLPDKPRYREPEEVYFVDNLGAVVKKQREKLGLSKDQLAGKIKEKTSVIDRIEKNMRPETHVVGKLERVLGIRLMASAEAEKTITEKKSSEPLTLGDVVTIKKKKK